ncbi:MAG: hypothetical protein M0Z42_07955, partial [Actinomycetota bacterium]|nr:hypothetical protein [Actinomycetota bacterium]
HQIPLPVRAVGPHARGTGWWGVCPGLTVVLSGRRVAGGGCGGQGPAAGAAGRGRRRVWAGGRWWGLPLSRRRREGGER